VSGRRLRRVRSGGFDGRRDDLRFSGRGCGRGIGRPIGRGFALGINLRILGLPSRRLVDIERIEIRGHPFGGSIDLLLEVGHLGLAHRLLELALELPGHALDLGGPLADRAKDSRQLLRTDHDERDHADDDELTPTNVEHRASNSEGRAPLPANVLPRIRSRIAPDRSAWPGREL